MPVPNEIPKLLSHSSVEQIAAKLNEVVKEVYRLVDEAKRNEKATRKMLPDKQIDRAFFLGQVNGMVSSLEILCKTMGINLKVKE
jgi:Holliday junction resolvasome RuvABC endonuclease subunit